MADRWYLKGVEFANCNCNWGCPCQFNAPSTHGHCEAVSGGIIEEGYFNETRLDGLRYVLLLQWPGEIADGNGKEQVIIDERADEAQREGLRKIVLGEAGGEGMNAFAIFRSTMAEVLETLYAPIEIDIDVDAREARIEVPGLVESVGKPIINEHTGEAFRAGIHLPDGFEYTYAEMGTGESRIQAGIQLQLSGSYGQFNRVHMNQDGVVR